MVSTYLVWIPAPSEAALSRAAAPPRPPALSRAPPPAAAPRPREVRAYGRARLGRRLAVQAHAHHNPM
jgi:hypothetical protein